MNADTIATPPAELLGLVAPIAEQVEQVERMQAQLIAAQTARHEDAAAVENAEQADRQARADYARGKRDKTPRPTAPKAREREAEAAESVAVLNLACRDARAELRAAIDRHRDELTAQLDAEADRLRDELLGAVSRLRELQGERSQVLGLRAWLDTPERFGAGGSSGPLIGGARRSGEPEALGAMLTRIETTLAEGAAA